MAVAVETTRIERLRRAFLRHRPEICIARAVLITESYNETEDCPAVLRRAHAFHRIMEKMPIYIEDDELIVGNIASRPRSAPIYPEYSAQWILDQMDTFATRGGDKLFIAEEDKIILREVLPCWVGRTVQDRIMRRLPAETKQAMDLGAFSSYNMITGGVGHFIPGYERVLQKGFGGIRAEIEAQLARVDPSAADGIEKSWFYQAALICCDAVSLFANRYADLASRMAQETSDHRRRAELLQLAEVCAWVPQNPPRSFHEALQSFWFVHLLPYIEANGLAVSPGRFDQYMLPFLQRDVESGTLDSADALELLECLWVKFPNIIKLYNNEAALSFGGFPTNSCITLGGQTAEGEDATNDLSYLCLQATADTRLPDPSIAVRLHRFSPDQFVQKACEVIRLGTGMPKVFNDEVIVPALLNRRYDLEDARNYGIVGCVEPSVGGKTYGWCNAAYFNLAKCFELAIHDGVCPRTGVAYGVRTGGAEDLTSIGDVLTAYQRQVSHFVDLLTGCINLTDLAHREAAPLPLSSCLFDACIEKGVDLNGGGARYNFTGPQGVGTANVADSLAAIQHLVFEEHVLSMRELLQALADNFDGHETLHRKMLLKTPKFGNDDPAVDHLARLAGSIYSRCVESHGNPRGGIFQPGLYPVTANIPLGAVVGALPDGRVAGEALADGVSPVAGRDAKGPTAVMKSVARLEHIRASNGTLLNLKFSPSVVASATGLGKLVKLLRGYIALGGWHVQFNVIEAQTLREAQKNPDQYRDLLVRVAGYSAFFVELDQAVQDDIIRRTTHLL